MLPFIIAFIAEKAITKHASNKKIPTIAQDNDSALPWPYWCSLSAGFFTIFKLIYTTVDAIISEAEYAESAIIAVLCPMIPAAILAAVRRTLPMIPTIEAFSPCAKYSLSLFCSMALQITNL